MDLGNSDKMGAPLLGSLIGSIALAAVEQHVPGPVAWLVNTVVILGVAALVCRYKRSSAVWACFWTLTAICVIDPVLGLAGLLGSFSSPVLWVVVLAEVGAWYWLFRFPRVRPAAVPQTSHVIVHHVMHGALGQYADAEAGQAIREAVPEHLVRGTVPGYVEPPAKRRAISAAPVPLAKMAGALRSFVRR
jgi:hypothetical protein